jgi:hypothetical protein
MSATCLAHLTLLDLDVISANLLLSKPTIMDLYAEIIRKL